MVELLEIHRVVIIADTALEQTLLPEFLKLGAKGYNCTYCFGKGRHEPIEDPFTGSRSRIRVEVLARPQVAAAIMEFVHRKQFSAYAVVAYLDTVEVDSRDHFF
jgi:hypothetical protein